MERSAPAVVGIAPSRGGGTLKFGFDKLGEGAQRRLATKWAKEGGDQFLTQIASALSNPAEVCAVDLDLEDFLRAALEVGSARERAAEISRRVVNSLGERRDMAPVAVALLRAVREGGLEEAADQLAEALTTVSAILSPSDVVDVTESNLLLNRLDRAELSAQHLRSIELLPPESQAMMARLRGDLGSAQKAWGRSANLPLRQRVLVASQLHCLGESAPLLGLANDKDFDKEIEESSALLLALGSVQRLNGDLGTAQQLLRRAASVEDANLRRAGLASSQMSAMIALELARCLRGVEVKGERASLLRRASKTFCEQRLGFRSPERRAEVADVREWIDPLVLEASEADPTVCWLTVEALAQHGLADALGVEASSASLASLGQFFEDCWHQELPDVSHLLSALGSQPVLYIWGQNRDCPGQMCGVSVYVRNGSITSARWSIDGHLAASGGRLPDIAHLSEADLRYLGRVLLPDAVLKDPPATLVVCPSGRMSSLPVAALRLEDGAYLAERTVLMTTTSLALWLQLKPAKGTVRSATLALDATTAGGPIAKAALRSAGVAFGVVHTLVDLQRELIDESPDLMVLWCHGWASDGQPFKFGLGDRRISASELSGCFFPDRVFTAVCSSGNDVGMLGPESLVSRMLLQGAREVVIGVSPIDDNGTAWVFAEFLRSCGLGGAASALALAQRKMIEMGEEPKKWAALSAVARC